jgi:hypothetical protein
MPASQPAPIEPSINHRHLIEKYLTCVFNFIAKEIIIVKKIQQSNFKPTKPFIRNLAT